MPDSEHPAKSSRRRGVGRWAWALAVFVVLMIVLLFVFQPIDRVHPRVKEAVLKSDLTALREAIDNYTLDKQKPPASLQDLVDAQYLRSIPVDPMTNQRDWVIEFDDVQLSPISVANGIEDVHSNSSKVSLDGARYDSW